MSPPLVAGRGGAEQPFHSRGAAGEPYDGDKHLQALCPGRAGGGVIRPPSAGGKPKLDAKGEAILIALACSAPPEGRECWTMQLLADKLVEPGAVESISDGTVRRVLKT